MSNINVHRPKRLLYWKYLLSIDKELHGATWLSVLKYSSSLVSQSIPSAAESGALNDGLEAGALVPATTEPRSRTPAARQPSLWPPAPISLLQATIPCGAHRPARHGKDLHLFLFPDGALTDGDVGCAGKAAAAPRQPFLERDRTAKTSVVQNSKAQLLLPSVVVSFAKREWYMPKLLQENGSLYDSGAMKCHVMRESSTIYS